MGKTIRSDKFKKSCINRFDATKRIFRRKNRSEGRKIISANIVEMIEDAFLFEQQYYKELQKFLDSLAYNDYCRTISCS